MLIKRLLKYMKTSDRFVDLLIYFLVFFFTKG